LLAGAANTREAVVVPVPAALTIEGAPETVTPLTTVIDKVAVLEFVALVAVTVKVDADSVTVGVPLITPVEAEIANPVGSEGEIAHEAAAPPAFVGVMTVMSEPVVNVKVVGLILMFGAARDGAGAEEIVRFAETKVIV
jgi:hypothetical protein